MTVPNPKTAANPAVNPWSTPTKQVATWYRGDGELVIGVRDRATQRFGVNHQQYLVAGTPRTVLGLPVEADEHNYPVICVDGNDRIHVWANMHNEPARYIRSVDPIGAGTWLTNAGWVDASGELPDRDDRNTYFTPVMFPDRSMMLYVRSGDENPSGPDPVSGQANSYVWHRLPSGTSWNAGPGNTRTLLFQGLLVPDAGGPGIPGADSDTGTEDATNWSGYPTNFYVENDRDPHPGRMHVSWCWRSGGVDGQSNVIPSYAYSDDKGASWRAIDGTALTLPFTPLNNHACRIPIGSAFVRAIARNTGIVLADLDTTNHGFVQGDSISVYNNVASFIGTFTVSVVGPASGLALNQVAWGQGGPNESGSTGSVCKFRWFNWGAITVDAAGLPHIVVSTTQARYIRRNADNTAWVISTLQNPIGGAGGPVAQTTWGALIRRGDHIWGLTTTWGTPTSGASARARLVRVTGSGPAPTVTLSGDVGDSNWDPMYDPQAWALHGSLEHLAPDGDIPRLFTLGRGHRVRAA